MANKFSYTSISTYEQCPFKYKTVYVDKHYIDQSSIATTFGTLIHFIEESIANAIKENREINYTNLLDIFYNIEDKKNKLFGVNKIKKLFPKDFLEVDKSGRTYQEKADLYATTSIYRLERYLKMNSDLRIISAEQPFDWEYRGYEFHGCIDRILQDIATGEYIIEDIKTYAVPLEKTSLMTPMQFVIYAKAIEQLYGSTQISCAYDLPLCECRQAAGTKNFVRRGFKKLDKIIDALEAKEFSPKPSPLCHWCIFSKTYPNQPEEAKNLCPYFSHWTKENKTDEVEYEWMGELNHAAILEAFIKSQENNCIDKLEPVKSVQTLDDARRFLIRR